MRPASLEKRSAWKKRSVGFGLAVVAAFAVAACPRERRAVLAPMPLEFEKGGVRVSRLREAPLPASIAVRARAGDWLLETKSLKVVVGASGKSLDAQLSAGALLDATAAGWAEDGLDELRSLLFVDGREVGLVVVSVEPVDDGIRAGLRVKGRASTGSIEVDTDLRIDPDRPTVEIVTSVTNRGRAFSRVQLADRVRWLREPSFAPGLGHVSDTRRVRAPFLANVARSLAYALIAPRESIDIDFHAGLRGSREQVVLGPISAMPPGARVSQRRVLAVARGGLEHVAEVAWPLAGAPVGVVEGELTPAPEWARVTALTSSGATLLAVEARQGRFRLPLPGGDYLLRLDAPGGSDEQRVRVEPNAAPARAGFIVPEPRQLRYEVADAKGSALPARIVVHGVAPTPDPNLGPWHVADGAANVSYTATGKGTLALPAGRYRVLFTHGPEFGIFEQEIDVTERQGAVLRATLERAFETPGWLACDFHLHAEPSGDSDVPLRDRVIALLAEGVEFAVATDHNHVTDYAPAISALGATREIAAARGVEITTGAWGHFNAYPLPPGAEAPVTTGVEPPAIFAAVRARTPAALIQVNHPRMGPEIGYFNIGSLDAKTGDFRPGFSLDFDVIEVHNGFERDELAAVEQNLTDWFQLLELGRRYTAVGNSDSHHLAFQWAGYPRTYVRLDDDRPKPDMAAAVADALKRGRAIVSSGPFVDLRVAGAGPGELVRAENRRVRVALGVRAAPWIDVRRARIVVNGRAARELELLTSSLPGAARAEQEIELELDRDSWIVAIVDGRIAPSGALPGWRMPPLAFTNPVRVDVDGDGRFGPPALPDAGSP